MKKAKRTHQTLTFDLSVWNWIAKVAEWEHLTKSQVVERIILGKFPPKERPEQP